MSRKNHICKMDVCYEVNNMMIAYPCTFHFVDDVAFTYVKMRSETDDNMCVISNKMSAKDFLNTMIERYTGRAQSTINLACEDDFEMFADYMKSFSEYHFLLIQWKVASLFIYIKKSGAAFKDVHPNTS